MKKTGRITAGALAVLLILSCFMSGCSLEGHSENDTEAGAFQRKERKEYDLTVNRWADPEEASESTEPWTVTDYWEDNRQEGLAEGLEEGGTLMAADGQYYYVLSRYAKNQTGAGSQKYWLTCLNLLTLETERSELRFSAAEGAAQEELGELAEELAKEMDEGWITVNGMSVLDGKVYLTAVLIDRESKTPAHEYMIWTDSQGKIERAVDILPEIIAAGMYQDGILPQGLVRDREGYFFIGVEEASISFDIGIFDENGKFVKKLESPNGTGTGSATACTCRLADGRPVFECTDLDSDKTTIFSFDGQEEKVLYHGECDQAWARCLNAYGEILYLGYGGLMRWDAAEGECQQIYQSRIKPAFCKSIQELSDGRIAMIFSGEEGAYLLRLELGRDVEETVVTVFQMNDDHKLEEQADEYSGKRPNLSIQVTGRNSDESMDMALNRLMANLTEGKGPDIFVLSREQMKAMQEAGALEELSEVLPEEIKEQIFPAVLQYGRIKDGLYGISYTAGVETLLISGKVWEGQTWTVKDMAELMESNKNLERIADNYTANMLLNSFVLMNVQAGGSSLVDIENKECRLDTEEFAQALELCRKYGVQAGSGYAPPEEVIENVRKEKTLTYPVDGNLQSFSSSMAALGEDFHCVGYPAERGLGGFISCGECICLNVNGENKEEAIAFLQYLLGDSAQRKMGSGTVRRDILTQNVREGTGPEDPPVFVLSRRSITTLAGKPDGSSFLPEYLEIMDKGMLNPGGDEMTRIILEEAGAYFNGDKTAGETAEIIQSRVWVYLNEN